MSSEYSAEFKAELLDDFYAECDEMLTSARGSMTILERGPAGSALDRPAFDALFRAVHSLKGNSAIVGLRPAEELAHAGEGLLRQLSRRGQAFSVDEFDVLAAVLHRLEQIITTYRLGQSLPPINDLLARLEAYVQPTA